MHLLVYWQYLENIAYVIFCANIARLLECFNNISDRFRDIFPILQYFQGIFRCCIGKVRWFFFSKFFGSLFSVSFSRIFKKIYVFKISISCFLCVRRMFEPSCALQVGHSVPLLLRCYTYTTVPTRQCNGKARGTVYNKRRQETQAR